MMIIFMFKLLEAKKTLPFKMEIHLEAIKLIFRMLIRQDHAWKETHSLMLLIWRKSETD